jgi:hypothetical protein
MSRVWGGSRIFNIIRQIATLGSSRNSGLQSSTHESKDFFRGSRGGVRVSMTNNVKDESSNRRRFERVEIDFQTGVFVTDKKHKRIGLLRQLGRGGMMVEPERNFKVGKKEEIFIVDVSENLKVHLHATVRYSDARRVGFEFENLDANAAVDIGIIIGKYYSRDSVNA